MATARKLTPRQERFVQEYLKDLCATKAARRAGYSAKTADRIGPELLAKTCVAEAVAEAQRARSARTRVEADRVLAELGCLLSVDMGEILDFTQDVPRLKTPSEIPESARRALQSVKVKRYMEGDGDDAKEVEVTEFKLHDKNSAIRTALQHLGLMRERVELTGEAGGPVRTQGEVKHDIAADLAPYASAIRSFLSGGDRGPLSPDSPQQPVDSPEADSQAGPVPAP